MNKIQAAEQMRRALQMFCRSLSDEEAMEVATVYPAWEPGKDYKTGDIISYGENDVGDPQLYRVILDHRSQTNWPPIIAVSLYDAIGVNGSGYPVWSQPTGVHDAYNKGDIVDYQGTLYISLIDGNVYSPEAYPAGWQVYEG